MPQLENICKDACQLVYEVGQFIRAESTKVAEISVEEKALNSLVSYVDKEAEMKLVKGLAALIPDSGFLTEEDTINLPDKDLEWIVDPLDGTTNFLYGIPTYSISVALKRENMLVIGVVYEVGRDEMFYAWEGSQAYINKSTIQVSNRANLKESLLATGFPSYDYTHIKSYIEVMRYLMLNTRGLRRIGSAAVDLAYVAAGRFEGFFEYSLNPWDVAAGIIIIQQAGGKVTDFSGGDDYLYGGEIIATNGRLHEALLTTIQKEFKG